jgi:Fur family ferric uptake transcriptional regulator
MMLKDKRTAELKGSGLKATAPRLRILEVFQRRSTEPGVRHLSAEDVYRTLSEERIEVGLATVYRVLTQFEQAGLLVRRHFEAGRAVFELNEGTHHDHLVCVHCGHVEEFVDAEIEERQRKVAADRGFDLQEHALALYGSCRRENCANRPR